MDWDGDGDLDFLTGGDGLMDLLVGDDISISQPAEGLSDEDYQQKKAEYKKKSARLMVRYRELSETVREMDTETQRGFSEMYGKLYQSSSDFEETEMTGFVGCYCKSRILIPGRKPPKKCLSSNREYFFIHNDLFGFPERFFY